MSLDLLLREIDSLQGDIESDKITVRTKGLNRLNDILDNRIDELQNIEDPNDFWTSLFLTAFSGLLKQSSRFSVTTTSAVLNKNDLHALVAEKIVSNGNRNDLHIPLSIVFEKSLQVLEDKVLRKHFGSSFLGLLETQMFKSEKNLTGLKFNCWSRFLAVCFKIKTQDRTFNQKQLCEIIYKTVQLGTQYSYIHVELVGHLKSVENNILELEKETILVEWIRIAHIFCKNLIIDNHLRIHNFVNNIFHQITNVFNTLKSSNDTETKQMIFEFCDLCLIVHTPSRDIENKILTVNVDKWRKMLKSFWVIVESEMKYLNGQSMTFIKNPMLNEAFMKFASRLFFYLYWDEEVLQTTNDGGNMEQDVRGETSMSSSFRKRLKRSSRLQAFIDFIVIGDEKFNWRWFIVLADFVYEFPRVLTVEESHQLLELITNFQPTIKYAAQINALIKCCEFLIKNEEEQQQSIVEKPTLAIWDKFTSSCYRTVNTSNTTLYEYHNLISLLIRNRKFKSNQFLSSVLKDYANKVFRKNQHTLHTLAAIVENLDIDAVEGDGKKLLEDCLVWLHQKSDLFSESLKNENTVNLDAEIARLTVMCCITGNGLLRYTQTNHPMLKNHTAYERLRNDYERQLLICSLKSVMVTNLNFKKDENSNHHLDSGRNEDLPTEIRCVIDERLFDYAMTLLNFLSDSTAMKCDDPINLLHNVEIVMQMMNDFINFGALNNHSFQKMFLLKKLTILVQLIEKYFEELHHNKIKMVKSDTLEILNRMINIFSTKFHPKLGRRLRECDFSHTFQWVLSYLSFELSNSENIRLIDLDSLIGDNAIRYRGFHLLGIYGHFGDGFNSRDISEFLTKHTELNIFNNVDLNIIFRLIKIFCSSEACESKSIWIFEQISELCRNFYKSHQEIGENIIKLFKDVVNYIKICNLSDPTYTENTFILIKSFVTVCINRNYSPHSAVEVIRQIKYLTKSYPDMISTFESFQTIMNCLIRFAVESEVMLIKWEAISCLTYIFNRNWLLSMSSNSNLNLSAFHFQLFDSINFDETTPPIDNSPAPDDDVHNANAIRIQFLASILAVNYSLRKRCLFNLLELLHQQKINILQIRLVLDECCQFLNVARLEFINSNLEYLLAKWLIKNYDIYAFPWQLTDSVDRSHFINDNRMTIASVLLRYKCDLFNEFFKRERVNVVDIMEPLLSKSLAFLMPYYSKSNTIQLENYNRICIALNQKLIEIYSTDQLNKFLTDNAINVVENLLLTVNDDNLFHHLYGFTITFCKEEHGIDHDTFEACLKYIEEKTGHQYIILRDCAKRPLNILTMTIALREKCQKTSIVEEKLQHFMQYSLLMQYIANYLKRRVSEDIPQLIHGKQFYLRDACYFFCHLMSKATDDHNDKYIVLRIASCKYLLSFCRAVLPNCAELFLNFFNHIITTIVPITKHENREFSTLAQQLLRFMIVDNETVLEAAIKMLDDFPKDDTFKEYRQIHQRSKYKNREATLVFELENFLRTESGNVESLMALREHLATKKTELNQLYTDLSKIRGFSEDCETSILHKVTFKLLRCVKCTDRNVSIEAARCLGELGGADLTTIVLQPNVQTNAKQIVANARDAVENFCYAAFEQLDTFLLHSDIDVFKSTCLATTSLFRTRIGESVWREYSERFIFMHIFNSNVRNERILSPNITKTITANEFFEHDTKSHSIWIRRLTNRFLDILEQYVFREIVCSQPRFAERILPILIQYILFSGAIALKREIQTAVNQFFDKHDEYSSQQGASSTIADNRIYCDNNSIKTMLDIVECIRQHKLLINETKSDLNYLKMAKAALHCEAYFTAILYSELYSVEKFHELSAAETTDLHSVLREAYTIIGDLESAAAFVDPIKNRTTYLSLTGAWSSLLLYRDVHGPDTSISSVPFKSDLITSGYYYLSRSLPPKSETDYETLWRMADWSVSIPPPELSTRISFEEQHYAALKCMNIRDETALNKCVEKARQSVIDVIRAVSLECTKNVYKNLISLQMLQQIEDFAKILFKSSDSEQIIEKWRKQDLIPANEFKYKEQILSQRASLYKTFGVVGKRTWAKVQSSPLHHILLNLMTMAREQNHQHVAVRSSFQLNREIETAEPSEKIHRILHSKCILEEVQLQWAIGDRNLAKKLMVNFFEDPSYFSTLSYVIGLRLYGEYMAETQSKHPENILNDYLKKSLHHLEKFNKHDKLIESTGLGRSEFQAFVAEQSLKCYEAIAIYADREYQNKVERMDSPEFLTKLKNVEKNAKIIAATTPGIQSKPKDEQKMFSLIKKNLEIDQKEIAEIMNQRDVYLKLAITYYSKKCEASSDLTDLTIFRIISLWLSNKSNNGINNLLDTELTNIQSYKLLPILTQISAHLTTNTSSDDPCGRLIYKILERCAVEHPHHALNTIFAIANSYADRTTEESSHTDNPELRVIAAQELITRLKNNTKISQIVNQMGRMSDSLIELANLTFKTFLKTDILNKLGNLDQIQCPTIPLAVSPQAVYPDIVSVFAWQIDPQVLGGINAPKKVICKCSDGRDRAQIVKGKDDLRQDAVLQQVFDIVNTLLKSNKITSKQRLLIRTYKVMPLSKRSGILEFCDNTIQIGKYLLLAHKKYRPNDLSPSECRSQMADLYNRRAQKDEKYSKYMEICKNFGPVFHHFFLERFRDPGTWFERRLAYVRSVATNSMIGYVLGIGDRHVQNILMDETTAEVIHIDFGIAFEAGKALPTPESIPFRLTRDTIAPMGVVGVDGVFRKSCEKTMQVLRDNRLTINTILEVLLYDPLYNWSLKSRSAYRRQHQESDDDDGSETEENSNDETPNNNLDKNTTAERALMRVQLKLTGKESDSRGMSTIEGQVDRLILQAIDPNNLCGLFHGWQPYL